jgi:hypothetical protein
VGAGCAAATGPTGSTPAVGPSPPPGGFPAVGAWNSEAVRNAATIISVGARIGVPVRGWIIAVATAIQESSLINLPDLGDANNADSLGLFQQRPSQGWGTPAQIMDPVHASTKFYEHLLAVLGWQSMPLTQAAQAVQRSGTPNAYAQWEADATRIAAAVGSGNWRAIPEDLEHCLSNCPEILSNSGSPPPGTPPATLTATASIDGACATGEAVLARAATWLTAWGGGPVPYLSSADPTAWFDGYRRDCSGYASMALGLVAPGLSSVGLAARATPIPKTELAPGDLLINPAPDLAGHVVIFDHWTDATMTNYVGYEQSGDGGTHHRTIPYPYFGGYQMKPYRP